MKLQINVSPEFAVFTDKLVEAYRKQLPEDQKKFAPRSANQLIPLALVTLGAYTLEVSDPSSIAEANECVSRKPGPKKKDDRQTSFVDGLPGVWLSGPRIVESAFVKAGEYELSIQHCDTMRSAAEHAHLNQWGTIPETQNSVPGLRFIPPGTSLVPEPVKPPKPNTSEVGVFVADKRIRAGSFMILADCRIVPNDEKAGDVIRFVQAKLSESEESIQLEGTKESLLQKRVANSFRIANADAAEMGWTVRRENNRGKKGFRYIPPGAKLRYMLPEGEIEVGED